MALRAAITERAKMLAEAEPEELHHEAGQRERRGHKRSMPRHNGEGMLEADLREQRLVDRVPCRNFKKRHLKDLSEQEVDDIVALTQQPGWLKKNVAQKYRVSDMLISRICREAERELAAQRQWLYR